MLDKVYTGRLNDYYGGMLNDYQREVIALYCDFDMSLAEISAERDITRQAVRDILVRAERKLANLEEQLKLIGKLDKVSKDLENIIADCADGALAGKLKLLLKEIKEI